MKESPIESSLICREGVRIRPFLYKSCLHLKLSKSIFSREKVAVVGFPIERGQNRLLPQKYFFFEL